MRLGGILLIVGLLHGLNVLMLPIIGRILTLNRRLDEDTRRRTPVPARTDPTMFLLLIPFALVLVVLSVLGCRDRTAHRRATRGARRVLGASGRRSASSSAAGFVVIGVGALLGRRRSRRAGDSRRSPPRPRPADTTGATTAAPVRRSRRSGPRSRSRPRTSDVPGVLRRRRPARDPTTVLRMRATGFEPFARGGRRAVRADASPRCGNQIPVQFDEDGEARFQYLVTDEFLASQPVPGGCRADAAPCTIVVRAVDRRPAWRDPDHLRRRDPAGRTHRGDAVASSSRSTARR